MSEEERRAAERAEAERVEAERVEAERVEAERVEAEGAGAGGGGEQEEVEQLREENAALAEQNRELLEGMGDEGDLRGELAEERGKREALEGRVAAGEIERTRAAILVEQPELKDHLDLIGEDDPEKMRQRAAKVKKYGEERLDASRADLERGIAEKYGVPLGSGAEGEAEPEEVEARAKAVAAGDASAVAGQIVEKEVDKLV